MSTDLYTEVEIGDGKPTLLYRFYAADGSLLYIGITENAALRFLQHAAEKDWWPLVARKTALVYPSREEAHAAEVEAIRLEKPRHNKMHNKPALASRASAPVASKAAGPDAADIFYTLMRVFAWAKEPDVRQWHAQMVVTGAGKLLDVVAPAEGSTEFPWDMSPGFADAVLGRAVA